MMKFGKVVVKNDKIRFGQKNRRAVSPSALLIYLIYKE